MLFSFLFHSGTRLRVSEQRLVLLEMLSMMLYRLPGRRFNVIKSETLTLINLGGGEGAGSRCCFNW